MGTLSCLREQNEVADIGRYGIENFPLCCPKCKQDSLINAKDLQVPVNKRFEVKKHSKYVHKIIYKHLKYTYNICRYFRKVDTDG